jgi:hypothetical protein
MILRYPAVLYKPVYFLLMSHYELEVTLDLHYVFTPHTTLLTSLRLHPNDRSHVDHVDDVDDVDRC